ncbi:MAG: hypothetical protein ACHQUB_01130 [Candidatus Saccharimonadia bacterium]
MLHALSELLSWETHGLRIGFLCFGLRFPLWVAVLAGLIVTQVAFFFTTTYLHRSLAHGSVTLCRPLEWFARFDIWTTTGIKPRIWAAIHRKHHQFPDIVGDPHSPILEGSRAIMHGNVARYRAAEKTFGENIPSRQRAVRHATPDKWDRALFDNSKTGLAIGITLACLVFGLLGGALIVLIHTPRYLRGGAHINKSGHKNGYMNKLGIEVARYTGNNLHLAWLICGEGMHFNHSADPMNPSFAWRWWELALLTDWPYQLVLKPLSYLGLVRISRKRKTGIVNEMSPRVIWYAQARQIRQDLMHAEGLVQTA